MESLSNGKLSLISNYSIKFAKQKLNRK